MHARGRNLPEPPERLEDRIAPASFLVTSLADDGSVGTLRNAIEQANASPGHDTIFFGVNGIGTIVLTKGEIAITDALTIKGPGAGHLTIDAGNKSRIFDINYKGVVLLPTTISGMTLEHGNAAGDGGAVFSNETTVLRGLLVTDNHAHGDGGGVCISTDGKGVVSNCRIADNTANGSGGGLSIQSGEFLLVRQSIIFKNAAGQNGGGIVVKLAADATFDAVINSCKVASNTAGEDGGGVELIGSSATKKIIVRNSLIPGNRAIGHGGGVEAASGDIAISSSFVSLNIAGIEGGGIADHSHSLTIRGCRILANSAASPAGAGGGGILSEGPHPVSVVATLVAGNSSASNGGGVSFIGGITAALNSNNVLANNAAEDDPNVHTTGDVNLLPEQSVLPASAQTKTPATGA